MGVIDGVGHYKELSGRHERPDGNAEDGWEGFHMTDERSEGPGEQVL